MTIADGEMFTPKAWTFTPKGATKSASGSMKTPTGATETAAGVMAKAHGWYPTPVKLKRTAAAAHQSNP